jgi:hypothetical protein
MQTLLLYRELIAVRRALPPEDMSVSHDGGILRVRRGDLELVCNFADVLADVSTAREELVLDTGGVRFERGRILLPARAGAILR